MEMTSTGLYPRNTDAVEIFIKNGTVQFKPTDLEFIVTMWFLFYFN